MRPAPEDDRHDPDCPGCFRCEVDAAATALWTEPFRRHGMCPARGERQPASGAWVACENPERKWDENARAGTHLCGACWVAMLSMCAQQPGRMLSLGMTKSAELELPRVASGLEVVLAAAKHGDRNALVLARRLQRD